MGSVIPERFAVMSVDPGGTTGVAQGMFNAARLARPTTRAVLARAVRKSALRISEVVPPEAWKGTDWDGASQAAILYCAWMDFNFKATVEYGIEVPNVKLVIERFSLRQRSADVAPVEVTHAFLAYLRGETGTFAALSLAPDDRVYFQEPSEAMGYATNARLRDWGVWARGKEHGRDATRHLALRVSKILDGKT